MYIGLRWDKEINYWQLVFAKDTEAEARERLLYWRGKGTEGIRMFKAEEVAELAQESER
jgi:hypothetical protein